MYGHERNTKASREPRSHALQSMLPIKAAPISSQPWHFITSNELRTPSLLIKLFPPSIARKTSKFDHVLQSVVCQTLRPFAFVMKGLNGFHGILDFYGHPWKTTKDAISRHEAHTNLEMVFS